MSKWRDVKQNRINKNIPKKVLHSSLNFVSIAKRFKAFLTDTFLITTPILNQQVNDRTNSKTT